MMLAWEIASVVCPLFAEDASQIELEADQEQIENHTELRVDAQEGRHADRQELRVHVRRHPAEQRRAEHDAADHFPDHRRLADEAEELADDAGGDHDHGQREQRMKQRIDALPGDRRQRRAGPGGRRQAVSRRSDDEKHHRRDGDHAAVKQEGLRASSARKPCVAVVSHHRHKMVLRLLSRDGDVCGSVIMY